MKGGGTGQAVAPGDPDNSLLIQAVRQTGTIKMPKGGHLTAGEIESLVAWVKMGAPWPEEVEAKAAPGAGASNPAEYFENHVRPVLAAKCYSCHTQSQMSGLRVDSRQALLKGGETGPAIMPGDPEKSLLIQAVRQTGTIKMPKGGHLTPEEIATLTEWVKMGAPWPEERSQIAKTGGTFQITPQQRSFWSFLPLKTPETPKLRDGKWAKTDIDRFVLAKLEAEGMKPVREADRLTLVRRATFDLTGLPPTPEEIAAFENDKSREAYAKVVDRLLASPRYGERWGRHWLDVARYSEDDVRGLDPMGRGFMPFRGAYVFRDWVIKAFNDDMPYGLFVKAQLAGDLLDDKVRAETLPGTAFLGGGPWVWDQAEPVQGRADERNERIDAVSRGFLGMTVACARCHDHKYDPIAQKDYYALAGVFASTSYKEYPRVSAAAVAAWRQKDQQIRDLEEEMADFTKTEGEQLAEIEARQTAKYMVAAWRVSGKPKLTLEEASEKDRVDPEMLERWVKFLAKPPKHYPFLKDWQAMVASGGTEDEAKFLASDFEKLVISVDAEAKKIKEENDVVKAKNDVKKPSRRDALPNEFETDDQFCPCCNLELKALPIEKASLWMDLFVRSIEAPEEEARRSPGLFVFRGYGLERRLSRDWRDHIAGLKAQIQELKKALGPEYPFIHGAADKPKPVNIAVNLRGNPHTLGEEAPRRFLAVLSPADAKPFQVGSGRLDLANDIVASPLAARVIVNRIWRWHFGTGIVNTPDNFGAPGERPSDPELLEYLAAHFASEGMSIKKLQREIMLSAAYRESADECNEDEEKDANDRLYWRFNRQRLDAESIRDAILFVAGDLDMKNMGGPSKPLGLENTRRTVYARVSRFRLDPFLQVFDFPNPSFTAEQRFSTNVPLQRLFFMNDKFVYAQAEKLAERVYAKGSDESRIQETFRLLFGRAPTDAEMKLGLEFLRTTPEKRGESVAGEPSTAWREYARVLLSSNEFEFVN